MAQNEIKGIDFKDRAAVARELGRSHVVIIAESLLVLFLLINSSYAFVDFSDPMLRPLILIAAVMVGIIAVISVAIAIRSFASAEKTPARFKLLGRK